jgi:pyrimidine-nucleoside phosphorylase
VKPGDLRPLIDKKRHGNGLNRDEIRDFVAGVVHGAFPDYQIAAFLMAVVHVGLNFRETVDLTREMAGHGERLARHPRRARVGKHSTGGVGDKTSFLLGPLVASYGVQVPLMSGRGLGHTGGTIDKLSGISGLRTVLPSDTILRILKLHGFSIFEQSAKLGPADRKLYALRDATATVASLPLIVASILSKKLIEGLDGLVLDVKYGAGSFLGPLSEAKRLAQMLLRVAKALGLKATVVLSAMEEPLGMTVGNNLEILECLETLRGQGPQDLVRLTVALAREMLVLGLPRRMLPSSAALAERLTSGVLVKPFLNYLRAQGGRLRKGSSLRLARRVFPLKAAVSGRIAGLEAREIGLASMELGAGRTRMGESIDPSVGLCLLKKVGDLVRKGEAVADLFYNDPARLAAARRRLQGAIRISSHRVPQTALVKAVLRNYKA